MEDEETKENYSPFLTTVSSLVQRKEIVTGSYFIVFCFCLEYYSKESHQRNVLSPDYKEWSQPLSPGKRTHRMWAAWVVFVILTLEAHNLVNGDMT